MKPQQSLAMPRSVFPNYQAGFEREESVLLENAGPVRIGASTANTPPAPPTPLSALPLARSFLYRFLATAFEDPQTETWNWLTHSATREALASAALLCAHTGQSIQTETDFLLSKLENENLELFAAAHLAAFGHAARGECPLNEIEYGDIKADPLFQPHRLADLAAFYRAFGLELTEDADERQDHICLELEFMAVLAAKEAYARENNPNGASLDICLEAQKNFLREHLGRWTPAFTRRLARFSGDTALGAIAQFTRALVEIECHRFQIVPGSEDLLLRPIDTVAESLCDSCGLNSKLPGASLAALET